MKKLLLIIFGIVMTCGIYAQKDDFFTMKEIRLPIIYKKIIDSYITPYVENEKIDLKKIVAYIGIENDTSGIVLLPIDMCSFNSSLYYQYFDSLLVISSDPDLGKYILPGKERSFRKRPYIFISSDDPQWMIEDMDTIWEITRIF